MKLVKNPLLEESIRVYFSDRAITARYIMLTGVLAAVTFIAWPDRHFTYYIETGNKPQCFMIVLYFSLLLLTFLSGGFSIESISKEKLYSFSDWINLTPLSPAKIFSGKLKFAVLHTVFMILLILPFLVLSGSASGILPYKLIIAIAALGLFIFTYRTLGIFLHSLLDKNKLILNLILWLSIIMLIIFTTALLPELSPVSTLQRIPEMDDASLKTLLIFPVYAAISVVFLIAAYLRLKFLDKKIRNDGIDL